MLRKFMYCVLISSAIFLVGCTSASNNSMNQSNYEYRIIEDPSTGILTAFYEKDGNLYYKQITKAHTAGDNISLSDGGWTEMKPPSDIQFKSEN